MRIRFRNLSGDMEVAEVSRILRIESRKERGKLFDLLFITSYHTVRIENLHHLTEDDEIEETMLVKGFYDLSAKEGIVVKYK